MKCDNKLKAVGGDCTAFADKHVERFDFEGWIVHWIIGDKLFKSKMFKRHKNAYSFYNERLSISDRVYLKGVYSRL